MSLKDLLIDVGVLAALATAAFGSGYVKGTADELQADNLRVLGAEQREQNAQASLAQLTQRLTEQAAMLKNAQQTASDALAARDAVVAKLTAEQAKQYNQDRATLHENHDCAALAAMPVCPALSQRLFAAPGETEPDASGTPGH